MPENRANVLGKLALDALPVGLTAGFWFGGNVLATGSFLVAAETTGFFVGVGAVGAGLALAAAPVLLIGAIAVAVGDERTVADVSRAADELTPFLSPGTLSLAPISPFFSPSSDPMMFAKGAGSLLDLGVGLLSPEKFEALLEGAASYPGSKQDVTNLYNYYSPNQSSSNLPPTQNSNFPSSPMPSPTPGTGNDPWSAGGYPFDFTAPGDGDFYESPPEPNTNDSVAPIGFSMIIDDLNIPGASGTDGGSDLQGNGSGAGTPPPPDDSTGSDDSGGEETGTQPEGGGQTNPSSGSGPTNGGDNGDGGDSGGSGDDSGGSDDDSGGGDDD
jgi:uncharacterized membrane protein YgcG